MTALRTTLLALPLIALVTPSFAQDAMTGDQLQALLADGLTMTLGGKGEGYLGELVLGADGTGNGSAKTDAGDTINIAGTWAIKGDQFCRVWADLSDGKEVCETWVVKSDTSVEVYDGESRIGLNSW